MIRLTIKNLWAHKVRLALTSVAVVLGVAFMAATMVLTDTMGRTFDDMFAVGNAGNANFTLLTQRLPLAVTATVVHGIPGLPAPVTVREKSATRTLKQWDRIAVRVVPERDHHVISGALLPFRAEAVELLFDGLRDALKLKKRDALRLDHEQLQHCAPLFTSASRVRYCRIARKTSLLPYSPICTPSST